MHSLLAVVVSLLTWCAALTSVEDLAPDERAAYAYFGKHTAHGTPQSVPRYANLSESAFEDLALAGRPFVVEDGGQGQPFVGWTCDTFRKQYPNGVVKIEYVRGVKTAWPIQDKWEDEQHHIPNADPGGPQFAPWYWGVKGADDAEEARTVYKGKKNPLPHVQSSMRLPPFMRKTGENKEEVFGSPEFWFSMPKAGAAMHMDAHCESTFAIQLSGTRKWRVGWVPPVPNGTAFKDGTYADGAVYGKHYSPPLEAVVSEGEAFFMPSAFLHETSNVGDNCAVSLTFQFRDPVPARYFRHSLGHLRRSGDFNECWGLLAKLAGLGKERPSLAALDADRDGRFSLAEASGSRLLRAAHAFHDADADGVVTAGELDAGWADWKAAEAEAKGSRKSRPKSFAYLAGPRPRARAEL